ncbi:PKD domain-containing protein [Adhaeribacter sp. BT258]|uniref:PKD domain-containing protein n=1 Tax=Adhaeribacter terrigena TaxID=2793070 RepID=A0ABS1BXN2_9BACT|nr:PKD domain-containing protein [Adhaeribacter terrigena]MBK0401899.1 PKD domain-containing protein [Adhaeribacter terrigena]
MSAYSSLITRFLILLFVGFNFAACKGNHSDEPAPATVKPVSAATVGFTSDLQLADVNQTVTFTNLSANAARYTWYFGDGDSAHTVNAKHKFLHPGKYQVILKAYDHQNVPAIKSMQFAVGERFISGLVINKLKFTDPSGLPWDNGTGPDLWFGYIKITQENYLSMRRIKNNLQASQIPYRHTLETNPFLNEDYKFVLAEFDSTSATTYTSRQMTSWILNPARSAKWDSVTQTGYVELKNNDYEVRFNLKLKLE